MEKPQIIATLEEKLSDFQPVLPRQQAWALNRYVSGGNLLVAALLSAGMIRPKYSSELIKADMQSEHTKGIWRLTPNYVFFGKETIGNPIIAKINDSASEEYLSHIKYGEALNQAARPLGVFENVFLMTEAKGMPLIEFIRLLDKEVRNSDNSAMIKTAIEHARLAQLVKLRHIYERSGLSLQREPMGEKIFSRVQTLCDIYGTEMPDAAALAHTSFIIDQMYQNQTAIPKADMSGMNTWIDIDYLYGSLNINSASELARLVSNKKTSSNAVSAIRKAVRHLDFDKMHKSAAPTDDIYEIGMTTNYNKWSSLQNLKTVYSMLLEIDSKLGRIEDNVLDMMLEWDYGFQKPTSSGLRLSRKEIAKALNISFEGSDWIRVDEYEGYDTYRDLSWLFHANRTDILLDRETIALYAVRNIIENGKNMEYSPLAKLKKEISARSSKQDLHAKSLDDTKNKAIVYFQNVAEELAEKVMDPYQRDFERCPVGFTGIDNFRNYLEVVYKRTQSRSRDIYEYDGVEKDYTNLKRILDAPFVLQYLSDDLAIQRLREACSLFATVFEDASTWAARLGNGRLEKRYMLEMNEALELCSAAYALPMHMLKI